MMSSAPRRSSAAACRGSAAKLAAMAGSMVCATATGSTQARSTRSSGVA